MNPAEVFLAICDLEDRPSRASRTPVQLVGSARATEVLREGLLQPLSPAKVGESVAAAGEAGGQLRRVNVGCQLKRQAPRPNERHGVLDWKTQLSNGVAYFVSDLVWSR